MALSCCRRQPAQQAEPPAPQRAIDANLAGDGPDPVRDDAAYKIEYEFGYNGNTGRLRISSSSEPLTSKLQLCRTVEAFARCLFSSISHWQISEVYAHNIKCAFKFRTPPFRATSTACPTWVRYKFPNKICDLPQEPQLHATYNTARYEQLTTDSWLWYVVEVKNEPEGKGPCFPRLPFVNVHFANSTQKTEKKGEKRRDREDSRGQRQWSGYL